MCTAKKTPRMALVIPLLIGSCDKNLAQACIDYMSRVHKSNGNLQKDSLLYLQFVKIFLFAIDVATSLKSAMRWSMFFFFNFLKWIECVRIWGAVLSQFALLQSFANIELICFSARLAMEHECCGEVENLWQRVQLLEWNHNHHTRCSHQSPPNHTNWKGCPCTMNRGRHPNAKERFCCCC